MTDALADDGLLRRRHEAGGVASEAVYSACGRYRYALTRIWDAARPRVVFVMLNPSTATEEHDDPTIARCVRRARTGGWGAVRICNLFALRQTRPELLKADPEPVGAANDSVLSEACRWGAAVVAAWGVHGAHRGRGAYVATALRRDSQALMHLGVTKGGHPRHPLYLAYSRQPEVWR